MEAFILKRGGFRSSFTKTVNALKLEISKEDFEEGIIKDKFSKLEKLIQDIEQLNEKIINVIIDEGADAEQVAREMEGWEAYSDEFITMSRLVKEKLNKSTLSEEVRSVAGSSSDGRSSVSGNRVKSYKLPKIQLKQFDGDLLNWLPFWSQFEKIDEDPDLHESDKFQYLVQCMKPGSRAKDFIESYPVTTKNYAKAVSALKERFGKPDLLIEVYVRELIRLISSNVKGGVKMPLTKLFDKLEAQLRALESLSIETERNSCWLYPMVESTLSEDVIRAWQRSSLFHEGEGEVDFSRLKNLMNFLKREVEGEERLKLAKSGFEDNGSTIRDKRREKGKGESRPELKFSKSPNVPTASGFLTTKDHSCIFCNKMHNSHDCYASKSLSLQEKTNIVKEKRCCLKCLAPGHIAKACKQFVRCYVCGKAHPIILCPQGQNLEVSEEKPATEKFQVTTFGQTCSPEVALMTLEVRVEGIKGTKILRALLDSGSQRSYVLKSTAEELGLKPFSRESIAHTLFGGAKTDTRLHYKYFIRLGSSSSLSQERLEFEFLDQDKICGNVPRVPKTKELLKELKCQKVWLSDIGSGYPKIEMLIGSDIYGKILTGRVKQLKGGLTAVNTKLGWTVCGQLQDDFRESSSNGCNNLSMNLLVRDFNASDLWSLETIGISDPRGSLTKRAEEEMAQEQFVTSLSRNEEGRYSVGLPWLEREIALPSNRHVAEKRLFSTTRKLKACDMFGEYDNVFREWLSEGVIEEVPVDELSDRAHYLPHHPVIKPESSTTKVRPVFDASCKVDKGPSLNDCLIKGPNLIEEIPSILLRFREKSIGVTSDIRRAFLQIELKREDRNFLRFLWWEKEGQIKVYRHTRVVFGVTSSPFLLGAVISHHLSQVQAEMKPVADILKKSFYVDNCVTSIDSEEELKDFMVQSTEIFCDAKMDLRMWTYGPWEKISEDLASLMSETTSKDPVPVLGMLWNRDDDTLSIQAKGVSQFKDVTKREILSIVQGVFDPLGILAPVLITAKLLMQEVWASKSSWDTPLPEEIRLKFLKWVNELQYLSQVRLARRLGFGNRDTWSLHVFCDASQNAYATVVYLRCEENGEVFVKFLAAKSRVTPLKRVTIPRLELLACLLGARLSKYIAEALSLGNIQKYFWSDSTTALSWIKRNDEWGTFVGNRVREICSLTDANQWSYVSTQLNPADLPSRGCNARQLLISSWWDGPNWLRGPSNNWFVREETADESLISSERKKTNLASLTINAEQSKWYEKFSKFSKIVKVLAWVLRFSKNCKKSSICKQGHLTGAELHDARDAVVRVVQSESFPEAEDAVHGLQVIKDQTGLIRVKTKILEREDEYSFKYPVLLPSKHHIVESLILDYHQKNSHAGVQTLMNLIREEYWVIAARRSIRSAIRKCSKCQRFNAKAPVTGPIHLPAQRVRDASVFEIIGIDLCGPLVLQDETKAWVVLFTCAVYRAVHLELVTSVSTESFLLALRRFIARRGRPATIYCDNGTNFTGAAAALSKIKWNNIIDQEVLQPIEWKFIPPTAAWWGGWWERLIRSTKSILVRVLGKASVKYEELLTILCDAEAVLNHRPLTYMSSDPEDLVPLTPANFLQDVRECGTPDLDYLDQEKLSKRQRYCQELRRQFRVRFRKEYLSQLIQKAGRSKNDLKVGDVVLVGSENQKRLNWPLAVVQELYPGRDGHVRVVKVKTQHGILVRPVQKLYPLEVSAKGDPILRKEPCCPISVKENDAMSKFTSSGRRVKAPKRFA